MTGFALVRGRGNTNGRAIYASLPGERRNTREILLWRTDIPQATQKKLAKSEVHGLTD
jgi:hypothetical protein